MSDKQDSAQLLTDAVALRHQAEESLEKSERFLRSTVDGLSAQIAVLDERGEIILTNKAYRDFAAQNGAEPSTVSDGVNYLAVCDAASGEHSENAKSFAEGLRKVLSGEQQYFELEYPCHSPDENRWFIARVTPFSGEGPRCGIVAHENITVRKQAEAALKQLNEDLEGHVERRTHQLAAARDEAERANAAKSEFLSRMSHELRTPLNAILGFSQLLESDPDYPLAATQADNAREIRHAGEHLLELVNEVLDLSRIESGRLEVSLELVAIADIVNACVAQIQPLAARRDIRIVVEPGTGLTVHADRARLRGVLLNLLSNAVKYNREGGRIEITCAATDSEYLRVSVADTGRGIAPENLSRLFRPFERMESSLSAIEGTGIGLALAKKLVEAMHGEIGVDTVPGEGSTFWFELPLSGIVGVTTAGARTQLEAIVPVATNNARHRVLYVEDNPANLRLVQKILAARKDIELLDTATAEAGLIMAGREQLDLILLDLNLPGMDGLEALRQLRANPATRDIPVIAVTANAMTHNIQRGIGASFNDFITKPLNIEGFLAAVDRQLSGNDGAMN